jgi:hypothetical protein
MITLLIGLASTILPSLLGLAERQLDRKWEELRDDKRMAHKERIAWLHYRQGRYEQMAAIQGSDKGWSPNNIVRIGFAAPFVLLINFLVWHWMLTGAWYQVDIMPEIVQWTMLGVLNFYLMFEGVNVHGAHKTRQVILSDPGHRELIEEAGKRREDRFRHRHGPKGQDR